MKFKFESEDFDTLPYGPEDIQEEEPESWVLRLKKRCFKK